MFEVLLHPIDAFRTGSDKQGDDLSVLQDGDSRRVTCFLRGSAQGLPDSFTYGTLTIRPEGMAWRPYWRHRRRVVSIPRLSRVASVGRPTGPGAWNIKRNLFKMVETTGPDGTVEFAVPGGGPELIRQASQTTRIPPPD
jgi:hypothetical protein